MQAVVDDLVVNYQSQGQGPVILMLHGWGVDLTTFKDLANKLSAHSRVIRLDFPGFGGSHLPKKSWDVSDYAKFLVNFLNKIQIQPDFIIGHSFGGRVAIKALSTKDLTGKKLVLMSSAGVKPSVTPKAAALKVTAKAGKVASKILPNRLQSTLRRRLYEVAGSSDYLESGPLKETFIKVIKEDLTKDAERLDLPTLLIWGANDDVTPLDDGKLLKQKIKKSQLQIIPSGGHFIYLDKPQEVVKMITNFLA